MKINSVQTNFYSSKHAPSFGANIDGVKGSLKRVGEKIIDEGTYTDFIKYEDYLDEMKELCHNCDLKERAAFNRETGRYYACLTLNDKVLKTERIDNLNSMGKVVSEMRKLDKQIKPELRPNRYYLLDVLLGDEEKYQYDA